MIKKLLTISSPSFNPYYNLALEKYLFDTVDDDTIILYLWQNERTVVCGRNQNIWKECHISKLIEEGGYPARRLSGGGAVFHDLGNLNFTFLLTKDNYDIPRQLEVILNACQLLGIDAQKTGRNDITVNGRKFSGNAFYKSKERRYHHGTLLVSVDLSNLSTYLNVDKAKLASKGVDSVRSRVTNLIDYCPELTIELMKEKMIDGFEKVYQLPATTLSLNELDSSIIESYMNIYKDDEWLYGRRIPFAYRINKRFPWGDFDLNLNVNQGIIENVSLFSDANDEEFIRNIASQLEKIPFTYAKLSEVIKNNIQTEENKLMAENINALLFASI